MKRLWLERPIFWFLWSTHWLFAHRVVDDGPGRIWCPDCLRSWPKWYRRASPVPDWYDEDDTEPRLCGGSGGWRSCWECCAEAERSARAVPETGPENGGEP